MAFRRAGMAIVTTSAGVCVISFELNSLGRAMEKRIRNVNWKTLGSGNLESQ